MQVLTLNHKMTTHTNTPHPTSLPSSLGDPRPSYRHWLLSCACARATLVYSSHSITPCEPESDIWRCAAIWPCFAVWQCGGCRDSHSFLDEWLHVRHIMITQQDGPGHRLQMFCVCLFLEGESGVWDKLWVFVRTRHTASALLFTVS